MRKIFLLTLFVSVILALPLASQAAKCSPNYEDRCTDPTRYCDCCDNCCGCYSCGCGCGFCCDWDCCGCGGCGTDWCCGHHDCGHYAGCNPHRDYQDCCCGCHHHHWRHHHGCCAMMMLNAPWGPWAGEYPEAWGCGHQEEVGAAWSGTCEEEDEDDEGDEEDDD